MGDNKRLTELCKSSSEGDILSIEKLFKENKFDQNEIDCSFRSCIENCSKEKKDQYIKCLRFFTTQTADINYKNENYNNTTLLMYAFDKGASYAIDVLISTFEEEGNINSLDINNENCIFHIIKTDKFSEEEKLDFLNELPLGNLKFNQKNSDNKTIFEIMREKNAASLMTFFNELKDNKRNIQKNYNDKFYNGKIKELSKNLKKMNAANSTNQLALVNKSSLEYNNVLIDLLNQLKLLDEYPLINYSSNIIDPYLIKIISLLYKVKIKENPFALALTMNKLTSFFQLDNIKELKRLINEIKSSHYLSIKKELFIYYNIILIDMLIERNIIEKVNVIYGNLRVKLGEKRCLESDVILPIRLGFSNVNDDMEKLMELYNFFITIYNKRRCIILRCSEILRRLEMG
jgi:hypothetical protein